MADVPSVLFMSCTDTHPDDIIKIFLDVEHLPEKVYIEDEIYAFPWKIDNKYYTAEVYLCPFPNAASSNDKFAESVNAVILYFDNSRHDTLEKIEASLSLIEQYSPEIKILATKSISNNVAPGGGCTKRTIVEWCVGKGFELVELEPNVDEEDSSLEDDTFEETGVKRIIQALDAHVWPNLVMKNSNSQVKGTKHPESQSNFARLRQKLGLDESLDEMLNDDNDDDFSQLFSQLSAMKERVSALPETDRKDAAEQVVKAFWKAMGGDDSEFMDN
ncbi:hypothetical protein RUM43_009038 [Polyplax serrata]|uniref:Alpha-and gamma-adaptin-binding protein p34 n=1 Tax=Polyplax serrata TaxID=468196 RepID=A0AAN8NPK4_POLSC